MKPTRLSLVVVAACCLTATCYGCWHQFSAPSPPLYQLSSSLQTPLGAAYPGTRELMDAPSNDPALSNDHNGVELRP